MTTTRRIAREAALWIGGALGALCLLSFVAGWALHVTPLVFSSGSMTPTYGVGALGISHEVPASDLRDGDVVSVINDEGVRVTHRIVGITHDGSTAALSLRGDANNVDDAQTYRVTSADRVVLDVPYAGYALNAAASPYGVAVTAAAVMGLLLLGFGGPSGSGARRRARRLVPAGVASVLVVGGLAGVSGAVPWAFTSAYWTDTATVTTTASTPTVTLTQPTCASNERSKVEAVLTFPSLGSTYEYVWKVTRTDGTQSQTGVIAASAAGTTVQFNLSTSVQIPSGGGGNASFVVTLQARLVSDHATLVGSQTSTQLHSSPRPGGPYWALYCGA